MVFKNTLDSPEIPAILTLSKFPAGRMNRFELAFSGQCALQEALPCAEACPAVGTSLNQGKDGRPKMCFFALCNWTAIVLWISALKSASTFALLV
jgi:hypothetical protein